MTKNPRILVVDDAPLTRGLLEQVLKKYGYRVDTAENGQQAIDYFLHHPPDLILMDADMPIVDGVTACARIKQLPEAKHLPIIMVTALVERQWIDRAYAAGATDYITKPLNWDVLRNRIHYILQAKQIEEALFDEKEKALVTLASICDGVITTNAKGEVEFLNSVAAKLTGWTTEEAQGLSLNQVFLIIEEKTQQAVEFPIQRCLKEGQTLKLSSDDIVLVHRQGKKRFAIKDSAAPIKDRKGRIIGLVLVFHDVTETRKMTRELSYKAKHDALTGLYNRHEFKAQLQRVLDSPRDSNTEHALFYMDLDQFKIVNDTCGHEAGDQLLKDVALILQRKIDVHITWTQATLARLGGDEFGLLLEDCSLSNALKLADSLCESIDILRFFWINDQQEKSIFTIGISIGLVPISSQTFNQKSLLAMADAACYAAKNAGRNGVYVYQENDEKQPDQNIQWVSLINDNFEKEQGFSLFYQPILSLRDASHLNNSTRYEILLRMKNQQDYLVPPGAFFSAAIRYNLMPSLDLWVIDKFLSWLNNHPQNSEKLTFATLNISGLSLGEPNFAETVIKHIKDNNIPAHKLGFEISETAVITNLSNVLNFMTALKELGCCFILDNFGSGIASFNYLKQMPIDFLKIDGALIKGITNDTVDYATIKAINEIAHVMYFQTIAEFVENEAIFNKLQEIGVDYVQGYWIGEPKALID